MAKYYVGIHKDEDVYKNSSSGGAFTAITDLLMKKHKGVSIFGCVLNEKLEAVHIRGTNKKDRDKMRGSKYISSKLGDTFQLVMQDLKNDKYVIFTGTPCQVAGLKTFLEIKKCNIDKLITIDFICHGVGENQFFYDYIKNLEKKYHSRAVFCKFRGKTKPGKFQDMLIEFENGKRYSASTTNYDWFYSVYHSNLILKACCYECNYSKNKLSDITLGDDWSKNRDLKRAHSLIIANNKKAEKLIKALEDFEVREVKESEINQPNSKESTRKPENYDVFWKIYRTQGYLSAQKFFGNNTIKKKIIVRVADVVDKLNLRQVFKRQ